MAAVLDVHLTGGSGNSDPDASLGGVTSGNAAGEGLHGLFDLVTSSEASAGDVEYRAVDLVNSGDAAATLAEIYMFSETSSVGSQLDMGVEASPIDSSLSIVDESTPPAGVTFGHYNSGSRLSLPDIPVGSYCRVWLKRIISAGAGNDASDTGTIGVSYA